MKTILLAFLIGSTVVATSLSGCGGSGTSVADPAVTASSAGSAASAPAAPTTPPPEAPPVQRLAIGPAKVTIVYDQKARAEITIAADGEIIADVDGARGKKPMKRAVLTVDGTLRVEGKPLTKLDDAGTISVVSESIQKVDGKVVKSETRWEPIGTLDADGTFTATKDGKQLVIAADGKVVGFPFELEATIEAADPAHRRAAMIMVLAMFVGRSETDMSSASAPAVAP